MLFREVSLWIEFGDELKAIHEVTRNNSKLFVQAKKLKRLGFALKVPFAQEVKSLTHKSACRFFLIKLIASFAWCAVAILPLLAEAKPRTPAASFLEYGLIANDAPDIEPMHAEFPLILSARNVSRKRNVDNVIILPVYYSQRRVIREIRVRAIRWLLSKRERIRDDDIIGWRIPGVSYSQVEQEGRSAIAFKLCGQISALSIDSMFFRAFNACLHRLPLPKVNVGLNRNNQEHQQIERHISAEFPPFVKAGMKDGNAHYHQETDQRSKNNAPETYWQRLVKRNGGFKGIVISLCGFIALRICLLCFWHGLDLYWGGKARRKA